MGGKLFYLCLDRRLLGTSLSEQEILLEFGQGHEFGEGKDYIRDFKTRNIAPFGEELFIEVFKMPQAFVRELDLAYEHVQFIEPITYESTNIVVLRTKNQGFCKMANRRHGRNNVYFVFILESVVVK